MAIQSFTVNIDGKDETIEFEDDPPFGDMQRIIKSCVDLSDVSRPQVNLQLYQQMILQSVVTKAPFNPKNSTEFAKLLNRLMQAIPLEKLLAPMITAATGSQSLTK